MSEHKDIIAGTESPPTVIEARPVLRARARPPLEALELENRLWIRSEICRCLTKALRYSTAGCFGLIVLQGFHPWGFQIDPALLKWIVGATIVQGGGLLGIFVNAVWQKPGAGNPRPQS